MEFTPEPDVICSNLENFASQWESVEDGNGKKVFSTDTLDAIRKLREHIISGCILNIPPSGGTNHNVHLHHHLHSLFT